MNSSGKDAVILLSGGLDSMVCAGLAAEAGYTVHALTVDYGQRHRVEIESAKAIASRLSIADHQVLPLDMRLFGGSALTDEIAVPKGGLSNEIPATYVPARNLLFLSLALSWAEALGSRDIFIGVNALDYSGYPDCRPDFIEGFEALAHIATKAGDQGERFTLHAPLQHLTKAQIAAEASRLGLDPAMSWSCYDPQADGSACGECDSCRLRKAGMDEAGIDDTTHYAV